MFGGERGFGGGVRRGWTGGLAWGYVGERRAKEAVMTAQEFDEAFDAGEDVSVWVDWSKARRGRGRAR